MGFLKNGNSDNNLVFVNFLTFGFIVFHKMEVALINLYYAKPLFYCWQIKSLKIKNNKLFWWVIIYFGEWSHFPLSNFLGNDVPKENTHYTCIACITIDSVLRIDKKNHPQVYLEECKYKVKETQMSRFINTELKSHLESSDSDSEKVDNELMTKLKSDSDNDSE